MFSQKRLDTYLARHDEQAATSPPQAPGLRSVAARARDVIGIEWTRWRHVLRAVSAHASATPPPRAAAGRRGLYLLLAVVLALDLTGLRWGLPHLMAPHVDDAGKPALDAMRHFFLADTKYPKLHLMLLGAAYAPYLLWLWITGGLQLAGTSLDAAGASVFRDPAGALTTLLLIARGVTVGLHLGSVALLWAAARRLVARPEAALFGAALWGLAPVVALFARSSNVDVPMCFWLAAAVLQFLRVRELPTRGRLLGLAAIAVAGVGTKDQIVFALAPFALAVPVVVFARRTDRRRALRDLALAAGVALLAYGLLSDLLWNPAQWAQRQALWREDLARFVDIAAAHVGAADLARDTLRDLFFVGSPALAVALLAALASLAFVRTRQGLWCLGLVALYPLLLMSWLGFEQPRYVMPSVLFGCLFVACRADAVLTALTALTAPTTGGARRPARAALGFGALLLLAALLHGAQVAWALTNDSRTAAQAWIAAHVAPGAIIETYQDPNHLPGLQAAGLNSRQTKDMSLAGLAQRRPEVVVISDDERWRWSREQITFVRKLFDGVPGYTVVTFGPRAGSRAPLLVDPTSPARFWPDIAVLVRAP